MGSSFQHRVSSTVLAAALAVNFAGVSGDGSTHAASIQSLDARIVAEGIAGASAISQVGTFLNGSQGACGGSPIPTHFASDTQPGAVLDPNRIFVGSLSNFGAALAVGVGQEGSFLSIDPSSSSILNVPAAFVPSSGGQASALNGFVQMFSANSPFWANSVNNGSTPFTAQYTGVSNPLGLSNNYAFGRIWPANAPFGDGGVGSSTILDPTGRPLASPPLKAPNPMIGGVYVGTLTDRSQVFGPQIIPGGLNTGAVGTAFLGPSPDGTCKAVFAVVTADGAISQEHTLKGLDGLAQAGTVQSMVGRTWDPPNNSIEPRLGVLMNPYIPAGAPAGTVLQLLVSEPFNDTVAVVNLGVLNGQVFQAIGATTRFSSSSLHLPVDLAPVQIDRDDSQWASNTTLDEGSDFYVLNRGNSTIVRMSQNGSVVAVRRVNIDSSSVANASLNGIATSSDGSTIYLTFVGPGNGQGGMLAVPSF